MKTFRQNPAHSSKLRALIETIECAFASGTFSESSFSAPATNQEISEIESILGVHLPSEFREFCENISRVAPCPYTPIEESLPDLRLDDASGLEVVDFLSPFSVVGDTLQPFPLTTSWEGFVPEDIFGGGFAVTQVEPSSYNRRVNIDGIPPGKSPFDGLYELMTELHYCDSWFVGFYLVSHGQARGQVWLCFAQITQPDEPNLSFRPLADSFLDWYLDWLT